LIFWSILLVVAVVLEFVTQQLVSVWFAAGALGALLTAAFGGSVWMQLILFAGISLVLLLCTRPFLKRFMRFPIQATDVKRDVGKLAVVVQEIDAAAGTGRARLGDVQWRAVAKEGGVIPVGTTVRVEKIDGTRLLVSVVSQEETRAQKKEEFVS
jgi:membrane protein implicated in regulation of membrane protease activity